MVGTNHFIALSSQHLNLPIPSHHLCNVSPFLTFSILIPVSFPLPICLPDGSTTVPISHRNPPSHLKTSDHMAMLSSFITKCTAKKTGIKAHAWPVGEKHSACEIFRKRKNAAISYIDSSPWRHWDTGASSEGGCASDDIVSSFWPVSWLTISVVFTVDPVKTKKIFTTLFIHIFNRVESTCLLRLNSVPSLQKQVYARLTPKTREKEKSFSIWAYKMPLHRLNHWQFIRLESRACAGTSDLSICSGDCACVNAARQRFCPQKHWTRRTSSMPG